MVPGLQGLLGKLQIQQPKMFQIVYQAMNSGGDPNAFLKQIMSNATPEQKQDLIARSKQYGVPENILKQLKDMK